MMRFIPIFTAGLAAVLFVTGCVNLAPQPDTTRFFVLGALPQEGPAAPVPEGPFFARPEIPAYLRGDAMVYRTAAGELKTVGGHRWGEPVDEGVARALAQSWSIHSGQAVSGFYPWARTDPGADVIRVRLHEFGADDRGVVVLVASWERDGAVVGRFSSRVDGWDPGDPEGLVDAMNTLLDRFAAKISGR